MAETINGIRIRVYIDIDISGPTDGVRLQDSLAYEKVITDGTGVDQLGQVFFDKARSLAATNEDLDMNGATNKDSFLQSMALAQMGLVYVRNKDTTAGHTITVSQPAANGIPGPFIAASDGIILGADGLFLWVSPTDKVTVTAATGDLINVAASSTSTYDVLIGGDNT